MKIVNVICGVLVLLSLFTAQKSSLLDAIIILAGTIPLIIFGNLVMTVALKGGMKN